MREEVAHIRKDYLLKRLDEHETQADPILQFEQWFQEAIRAEVPEPNAMSLSTVEQGRPSSRIVLLKGFDSQGFVFYTNYLSRKGGEIASNPFVALNFFWPDLERQVRIEGLAGKTSAAESDAYYQSRDRGSRIGAWASPQSRVIPAREFLEARVAEVSSQFEGQELIPRPEHWGGYRVVPDYLEFWQGRKSRLHDRLTYRLSENGVWQRERLAP
ncbi:MAG: pyridoxamine 5'-phosphate oxidase [Bacteroidetes bacterium]|nr:MAG: pyridoxamine 5'-phosphate oxidase [Bacteroidota bacterium]